MFLWGIFQEEEEEEEVYCHCYIYGLCTGFIYYVETKPVLREKLN